MKKVVLFAVAGLIAFAAVFVAARPSVASPSCYRLVGFGGIKSSPVTAGCSSPVGLCTAGQFHGDLLLNGTTSFVADGLAPAAGLAGAVEASSTLSYSGLLTITTVFGTLITRDTGIFDTAAGLFASRDVIVGGTGIFTGATGHLFFSGTGTTTLDSTALGQICLTH